MRLPTLPELACGGLASALGLILAPAVRDEAVALAGSLPAPTLLLVGFLASRFVARALRAGLGMLVPRRPAGAFHHPSDPGSGRPKASTASHR